MNQESRPTLRPLQVEAVDKMYELIRANPVHGVYNASEPGTGKCAMSISLLNRFWMLSDVKPGPVVIVCPKSVKLKWRDELKKWLQRGMLNCASYDLLALVISSPKDIVGVNFSTYDFIIVNYEQTRNKKILAWLNKYPIYALIIDECHRVKSTRKKTKKGNITQKGAVVDNLWPNAHYKICLSGTPFTNGIADCWTLFSRLAPNNFTDYYSFVKTYCYEDMTPWGPKYYGLRNADKLRDITRKNFLVRYTLDAMAPELPEIQWTKVPLSYEEWGVKPTKEEIEANKKYIRLLDEALEEGKAIPQPPIHLSKKRIDQSLKKLPALIEIVKESVDNLRPTLVFFCYIEPLLKFCEEMKDYNPSLIYGANTEQERYGAIERFQSGATNLCVLQIAAGGVGTDLFRASAVIFAEMDYSPANIEQAIGRAKRIGNTSKNIEVIYPIVEETIEEDAADAVMSKARMFKKVLE